MIIGLMTAVERQQYCLFFLKNFAYNNVFRFQSKKTSIGEKLTIDTAIFKVSIVIWLQAIDLRKPPGALHKQLLVWP